MVRGLWDTLPLSLQRCRCGLEHAPGGRGGRALSGRGVVAEAVGGLRRVSGGATREGGVECGHLDRLRGGEVPREPEPGSHEERLAELGHPRAERAAHAADHEARHVPEGGGAALGQEDEGHRVEDVLEDSRTARGDGKVLSDVELVKEHVRMRLPGRPFLPRRREQRRLLARACLLLLQQHAAREPADQCGDEDCKRGGRHLREEDAASAQLDDRLDGDEAGEDHREACGAGRLFVPLPARHEEVDEEGRADRKQAVEGAHERDDPHRAGDGAQRRDHDRLARDARKEKVKDGRRHHHVRRRRHVLAQEVLDQLPVADPIAHAERAEAGQQPVDGGGALLV
mmetsp:Transcript_10651/g.33812  ORF Transcript_10651/g.33812 Transcript_10651/m.33812 type:complete len:342 (+) Transcript_10651:609-1634(+)